MKIIVLAILIVLLLNFPVQAQKEMSCNVSAYIRDSDTNGLNVRSSAGKEFKVIGAIPFNSDGTVVSIIASKGKWLKISGANNVEDEPTFSKTGWVFAPLLTVNIKGERLGTVKAFASANNTSKVIASLPIDTEYNLSGCLGDWMQISIEKKTGMISGWIPQENQCGNPWTTCP